MDELLSEIDNNICLNMKTLSFVRHKKMKIKKLRAQSTILNLKKKFYSASYLKESKINNGKLISKSNSFIDYQLSSRETKYMGFNLPSFSKKKYSPISSQIQREESTFLSTLMKPNTNISFNFCNNTDNKNIDLNNTNINNISFFNNINDTKNNEFSFNLSFDRNTMKYLNHNNLYSFYGGKNFSSKKFLENSRIIRKAKIIKEHCQKKAKSIKEMVDEEINKINKIEFIHKKNKKLFFLFFKTLNSCLNKYSDIKDQENEKLSNLKALKKNIIYQIEKIKDSILTQKDKLNALKEMKKFLFEVKFKNFVTNISLEDRKKFGFYEEKFKKAKTIAKKRLSFLEKMDLIRRKNFIPKKTLRIKSNFNSSFSSKNLENMPIFDEPEEFMYSFNYVEEKLNEDIMKCKTSRESLIENKMNFENIKQDFQKELNNFSQKEKRLLNNLFYQKKRNNILKQKLYSFNESEINEKNTLIKIVLKLKEILLKIDSQIKINNKFDLSKWNSIISNNNNYYDINEATNKSFYIIKILEKIVEDLIDNINKLKSNIYLNEAFNKIKRDIDKINNIKRYKLQISLSKKKLEEKQNKLIEKNKKFRFGSFLKYKIFSYEDKIRKQPLFKKKKLTKKKTNKYEESMKWFSFD